MAVNYKSLMSQAVNGLGHSETDRIFEMAAQMADVVVLAMGQPDFNTPDNGQTEKENYFVVE